MGTWEIFGWFCIVSATVTMLGLFIREKFYVIAGTMIILMSLGFVFFYQAYQQPSKKFASFGEMVNLREVSVAGTSVFEIKTRIIFEDGKFQKIMTVPNTLIKIKTPEPENKIEGK